MKCYLCSHVSELPALGNPVFDELYPEEVQNFLRNCRKISEEKFGKNALPENKLKKNSQAIFIDLDEEKIKIEPEINSGILNASNNSYGKDEEVSGTRFRCPEVLGSEEKSVENSQLGTENSVSSQSQSQAFQWNFPGSGENSQLENSFDSTQIPSAEEYSKKFLPLPAQEVLDIPRDQINLRNFQILFHFDYRETNLADVVRNRDLENFQKIPQKIPIERADLLLGDFCWTLKRIGKNIFFFFILIRFLTRK
jgi:hypothetical protein